MQYPSYWFSFFHEAAHILLHSKKSVFVDERGGDAAGLEAEANEWASNTIVPQRAWEPFVAASLFSEQAVRAFADEQGIAPGIVVGRLQHKRLVPWTRLNGARHADAARALALVDQRHAAGHRFDSNVSRAS